MKLEIQIETESLERAASGAIWGNMWLAVDGVAFPEPYWNDIVVAYCAALSRAAHHCIRYEEEGFVCFYDGPFSVTLSPVVGRVKIQALGEGAEVECELPRAALCERMISAMKPLLAECELRGWSQDLDVRRLRRAVELLSDLSLSD